MHLRVFHRTGYHYSAAIPYAIQTLRLTPAAYQGLSVNAWQVEGDERRPLPSLVDGLGNIIHCHSVDRTHTEAIVTVTGDVETHRSDGVVIGAPEPMPPAFFLRSTPLTEPDAAITDLAREAAGDEDAIGRLHRLMCTVHQRLVYEPGHTDTQTSAAEALQHGRGVCQDHAHLFISAARALGIPARYVGGYLWTGTCDAADDASHAWAEAFVPGLGWIGFDAANGICPDEAYIRVSVGLDYWMAAPVRGLRHGTADEEMMVRVRVQQRTGAAQ